MIGRFFSPFFYILKWSMNSIMTIKEFCELFLWLDKNRIYKALLANFSVIVGSTIRRVFFQFLDFSKITTIANRKLLAVRRFSDVDAVPVGHDYLIIRESFKFSVHANFPIMESWQFQWNFPDFDILMQVRSPIMKRGRKPYT